MKPYESGYSNPPNIAASLGWARGTGDIYGTVFDCFVSGQDGEFSLVGNGFCG
jgi:hypothetical protein